MQIRMALRQRGWSLRTRDLHVSALGRPLNRQDNGPAAYRVNPNRYFVTVAHKQLKHKAMLDIRLRTRCAIPSPPADRMHRLRSEFFGFLLALAWHTE